MRAKAGVVYGVGINDADYIVKPTINGKVVECPFYVVWKDMIKRCYSLRYQARYPTYAGCSVCDEWLTFSKFKVWMQAQDWQGNQLDKDILVVGNKIYSPETCAFVSSMANGFTLDRAASRGDWPIGMYFSERVKKFHVQCRNPFSKKSEHLGYFSCVEEAHLAWKKRKHTIACLIADLQSNQKAAEALRVRYL